LVPQRAIDHSTGAEPSGRLRVATARARRPCAPKSRKRDTDQIRRRAALSRAWAPAYDLRQSDFGSVSRRSGARHRCREEPDLSRPMEWTAWSWRIPRPTTPCCRLRRSQAASRRHPKRNPRAERW